MHHCLIDLYDTMMLRSANRSSIESKQSVPHTEQLRSDLGDRAKISYSMLSIKNYEFDMDRL